MNQLASKVASRNVGGRSRALDVDRYVSLRIRQRRIMLGLTQQQLAELIGVTYQQAHKYETGINRISAGRLYHIARALGVDDAQADAILVTLAKDPSENVSIDIEDEFGLDLPNDDAARREARGMARDLSRHQTGTVPWRVVVVNAAGRRLFRRRAVAGR